MNDEKWQKQLPSEEGIYKMKSANGSVEIVKIENLVIDNAPSRPMNLHIIHINGEDSDDPDYYSLNSIENDYEYLWKKLST